MSSSLAFDKQGNPFSFHKRTRQLRVRLFRNPSARGTCSHVLDADGSPLYIDADTDYPLFRQLVGNVSGLYRLDQCDDDGAEVEDAPAAYITVESPRNAQAVDASDGVSALAVIREMAAVQREMAAIQGQALKALADNHALILASAAEVMRAPRPAPIAAEHRNANDEDALVDEEDGLEDEEQQDDAGDEEAPGGMVGLLAYLTKMIDPKDAQKFGSWVVKQFMQFRRETAADAPNVASGNVAAVPATSAPSAPVAPPVVGQAVPVRMAPSPEVIVSEPGATAFTITVPETDGDAAVTESDASELTGPTEAQRGQFPPITQEQFMHLATINAQLSPEEQAIAEQVMGRMDMPTMQRWLAELSALSVADATTTVREAVAEWKQHRNKKTR